MYSHVLYLLAERKTTGAVLDLELELGEDLGRARELQACVDRLTGLDLSDALGRACVRNETYL